MNSTALRIGKAVRDVVIVICLVVLLTTLLTRLAPGSPGRAILGSRASKAQVASLNHTLGADHSVWRQVGDTFAHYATGDYGRSLANPAKSVLDLARHALPVTATVIVIAVLLSLVFGIALGLLGGLAGGATDKAVSGVSVVILSIPPFVFSLLLILVLAVGLRIAPAGGWTPDWPGALEYAILPAIGLSALLLPQVARIVQQRTRTLFTEDFVQAAESRGLSRRRVALRHVLPNALLPVIAVIGVNTSAMIAGAVVVEAVFGLPGFGQVLQQAVSQRDYPVIQGFALLTAVAVVLVNLVSDLLYTVADPRTRVAA